MPIRVLCFRCSTTYLLPEMLSGRDIRCKQCQEVIAVPIVIGAPLVAPAGGAVAALLAGSAAATMPERMSPQTLSIAPVPAAPPPLPPEPSARSSSGSLLVWIGCGLLAIGLLVVGILLLGLVSWVFMRSKG
jgi:hypothetical protein